MTLGFKMLHHVLGRLILQSGTGSIIADHNVASAWKKGYTGKDITVAVVDDGLKYTHEDFKGRYVSKIEFFSYDYKLNETYVEVEV